MAPGSATARKAAFFPLPLTRGCEKQRQRIRCVFRNRTELKRRETACRPIGGVLGGAELLCAGKHSDGSRREDWESVCVQGSRVKGVVTRACGERCVWVEALMWIDQWGKSGLWGSKRARVSRVGLWVCVVGWGGSDSGAVKSVVTLMSWGRAVRGFVVLILCCTAGLRGRSRLGALKCIHCCVNWYMRAARSKADRNGEKCSHVYVVRTWLIVVV